MAHGHDPRCALAALLCCAAAAAQQPRRSNAIDAYVPLVEGASWHYRTHTSYAGLPPTESRRAVGVLGRYRDGDVERHLVRTMHGSSTTAYEHWQLHRDGLLTLPGTSRAIAAPDTEATPQRLLAAPIGAVHEWQWTEPVATTRNDREPEPWRWTARIVAYAEPVTVAAGTWPTVHVVATGRRGDREGKRESWYARGVGLLRSDQQVDDWREQCELLRHEPGFDGTTLRQALLQAHLPTEWLWSPRGPAHIEWLDQGVESLCLPGRFALLVCGGERRCAFVGRELVVPLDPGDAEAWRQLLGRPHNPIDPPTKATLACLFARLMAHAEGLRVLRLRCQDVADTPIDRSADRIQLGDIGGCEIEVVDQRGVVRRAVTDLEGGRLLLRVGKP